MKRGSRSEEHCLLIALHCVELSTYYVQKVKNAKMLQLDFFLKSTHTTRFLHYLNIFKVLFPKNFKMKFIQAYFKKY